MENSFTNTLFNGKVLIALDQVKSTNSHAIEHIQKSPLPEGSVFFSYNQTNGRGQFGNKWQNEPGKDIALSMVLYPGFLPADRQFELNMAVSLAVRDVMSVSAEGCKVEIKWPNDLLINSKKVAGILIENSLNGTRISSSVAGIGLNVNSENFDTLPDASSLRELTGNKQDQKKLINKIIDALKFRYAQLKGGLTSLLREEYLHALYLYQEKHIFINNEGNKIEGQILGISPRGMLQVEVDGKISSFGFKEIRF